MSEDLKQRIKKFPQLPGVYLMKDREGQVIYVGKAKDLRSRVRSYFSGADDRYNVQFLLTRVRTIETVVTEDERQALVLEADLVKKYKPKYNIRLKDDKAYLSVKINLEHQWPRIELVRKVQEDGAQYIGPFAMSSELKAMLDVIRTSIPLRTCSDRVIYNRVRPCLEYQIKRCLGPCCLKVEHAKYMALVHQAVQLLEGKNEKVIAELEREMSLAAADLRYEDAAAVRDRLSILKRLKEERPIYRFTSGAADAFGLYRENNCVELSVIMVRQGRLFESKTYGFQDVEIPNEELLASVLTQFYQSGQLIPDQILLPFNLEDLATRESLYSEVGNKSVKILCPKRGLKMRLLNLANANAKENFNIRATPPEEDKTLKELKELFKLEEIPRVIECADVSHFQGGATVGSIVCFRDGKVDKSRYRHFYLSQEGKPDDFASMREIVYRHLSRCAEENTVADLMIIDGGVAQLNQALVMRKELGLIRPEMISLAKRRVEKSQKFATELPSDKPERVFLEGFDQSIVLVAQSAVLHLLERIRDEAHRFAISFHRDTRDRRAFVSVLERIQGVGPKRKRDLLREFGSLSGIQSATVEELAKRGNLPKTLAEKIYRALNP